MDEQTLKAWLKNLRAELIARRCAADSSDRKHWSDAIESHLERLLTDVRGQIRGLAEAAGKAAT